MRKKKTSPKEHSSKDDNDSLSNQSMNDHLESLSKNVASISNQ